MTKELLQQALDALENSSSFIFVDVIKAHLRDDAIAALKSAIAQPARMLTTQEILKALVSELNTGVKHTPHEIVQRKFCEINGISLANKMIATPAAQQVQLTTKETK